MNLSYNPKGNERQIIFHKGAEKYIFRYKAGEEEELLSSLIDSAKNKKTSFNFYDAAVISSKITHDLIRQADESLGN